MYKCIVFRKMNIFVSGRITPLLNPSLRKRKDDRSLEAVTV